MKGARLCARARFRVVPPFYLQVIVPLDAEVLSDSLSFESDSLGSDNPASLFYFKTFLISMNEFLFGVILSGVTLFVDLDREELSSVYGDQMETSIGVVHLGFPVVSMFTVFCPIELIPNH